MSYFISRLETPPALSPEEIEEARRLFTDGFNTNEIAKEIGVSEALIYSAQIDLKHPCLSLPGSINPELTRNISAVPSGEPLAVLRQKEGA